MVLHMNFFLLLSVNISFYVRQRFVCFELAVPFTLSFSLSVATHVFMNSFCGGGSKFPLIIYTHAKLCCHKNAFIGVKAYANWYSRRA